MSRLNTVHTYRHIGDGFTSMTCRDSKVFKGSAGNTECGRGSGSGPLMTRQRDIKTEKVFQYIYLSKSHVRKLRTYRHTKKVNRMTTHSDHHSMLDGQKFGT